MRKKLQYIVYYPYNSLIMIGTYLTSSLFYIPHKMEICENAYFGDFIDFEKFQNKL